ncbi:MAG: pilus assembly protein PilM [Planctomycetota bacterium]|jgi:type IV pilus assembly protein PilM
MFGFGRHEIVGVDIGSSSVKIVQLRRGSAYWIVTNAGIVDISEKGAESPSRRESNCARAILNCVRLSGVKTRLAVCGVGGQGVAVRNFTFPAVPAEEIGRVVELEAKQVCPFDANDIAVDYRLLPDGAGKTTGYLVVAAGHLVKTKNRLAKKGRLDCALMDADALALLNCFREMENPGENHGTAILNIGHVETTLAVEGNKSWPFVRSVNYAGDNMIRAIAAENETTPETVMAVFAGDPKEIPQPMRESLERACERLITDITKTVRYYGAQEGSFDINKVLVCGGFSLFGDLTKLLQKHLSMEVVLWNPFEKMRLQVPRTHRGALLKSVLRKSGPTMAVAAGLAMRTI